MDAGDAKTIGVGFVSVAVILCATVWGTIDKWKYLKNSVLK